jgi:spore coat polysaccharide biosynthesis protein SpsF (cytidylyltransferase family)
MTILKDIWKFITGAIAKVKAALSQGSQIANQIKQVLDSPILDTAVKLTTTTLDDQALKAVRDGLATFIITMGWAEKFIKDFENDPDAKAAVLTVINAKASVLVADAEGIKLTIQQALASAPVVYRPEIMRYDTH